MNASGVEREEPHAAGAGSGAAADGASSGAPERHVMRWESFLPRRSLRVLLVESDDSTRQIVTALLRKCNYRVAGVADGMKAWEVMKEKKHVFDLVLTEVDMPSLSGIGLLTKVMAAPECKNIPVIMMSSHDSVNVVLKCMLEGAVDFLVKPVRKNELRNLWQHVWRRHCSNSYMNASDNNTASNHISANFGGRSKVGENSDERSDAQSSGSKPEIETEYIQKHGEPPQIQEKHNSEKETNIGSSDTDIGIAESVSKLDDAGNRKDYKPVGTRVNLTLPIQETVASISPVGNLPCSISVYEEENLDLVRSTEGNNDVPESYCQNIASKESVQNLVVFVEPVSNGQCAHAILKKDALEKDELGETGKSSLAYGTSPLWELSLRRQEHNGCVQPESRENHILKQSVASAFSRYGEKRIHASLQKSSSSDICIRTSNYVDKYHSLVNSSGSDDGKCSRSNHIEQTLSSPHGNAGETTEYFQASTNKDDANLPSRAIENDCASHSSNMENTTLCHPKFGFIPLPFPFGAMPYQSLCAGYGGILQPVYYPETSTVPQRSTAVDKQGTRDPSDNSNHIIHLINHSSFSDFHHQKVINYPQLWRPAVDISQPGDPRELRNSLEQACPSGSCSQDVLIGSGSNGSGETADGGGNIGNALESGNESGVQNCSGKFLDCDRSRREAALIKFRLKRKDRCFEKKVRYHSRKKLAEQRPRIKGQFVRQKFPESTTIAEEYS